MTARGNTVHPRWCHKRATGLPRNLPPQGKKIIWQTKLRDILHPICLTCLETVKVIKTKVNTEKLPQTRGDEGVMTTKSNVVSCLKPQKDRNRKAERPMLASQCGQICHSNIRLYEEKLKLGEGYMNSLLQLFGRSKIIPKLRIFPKENCKFQTKNMQKLPLSKT